VQFLQPHDHRDAYPEVADYHFVMRDYNLHQHNVSVLWHLAG